LAFVISATPLAKSEFSAKENIVSSVILDPQGSALVVDKFFPSAFSPHSLLSTNAVVGRAFTGSIISFHNSRRSLRIP